MSAVISTVKLHMNRRETTFLVPLYITGMVAVFSVLISLVFWRSGSQPGSAEWIQGSQSNPGIVYALLSFLVYLGVSSVATTFPFALTLGATRRSFTVGTLLWAAITSAYVAAILAVLSVVERATDHWFVGFYVFDVYVLGAGDIGRLLPIVFLGVLTALTVGGVFASAWVRFGARGPQLIAAGVVIVIAAALIVVVPAAAEIAEAFQLWWLAVAALAAIALSSTGTWLLLRPAVVR
ncbi:hypothetical protein J4G33_08095 [Actinotalea sp. BY-33]|uniref:Uncharacterized protein n=1 Tax=Actinotalea soli TaxID=2819234 RepID=A0A939LTD0_9CELL|nr:hypothetical protein [Actinotalea soli]MBO1751759.1 hypothetical protein [Actinotalea soli]